MCSNSCLTNKSETNQYIGLHLFHCVRGEYRLVIFNLLFHHIHNCCGVLHLTKINQLKSKEIGEITLAYIIKYISLVRPCKLDESILKEKQQNREADIIINDDNSTSIEKLEFIYKK